MPPKQGRRSPQEGGQACDLTPRARVVLEESMQKFKEEGGLQEGHDFEQVLNREKKRYWKKGLCSVDDLADETKWPSGFTNPQLAGRIQERARSERQAASTRTPEPTPSGISILSDVGTNPGAASGSNWNSTTGHLADVQSIESPQLKMSRPSFGTKGSQIRLCTNHFEVKLVRPPRPEWLAWQVDVEVEQGESDSKGSKSGKGTSKGKKGMASKGDAQLPVKEPPKRIRQDALTYVMSGLSKDSWLYDGRHRLWTAKGEDVKAGEHIVDKRDLTDARNSVKVAIGEALEHQQQAQETIDFRKIPEMAKLTNDRADAMDRISGELRFLQVWQRRYATEMKLGLATPVARGRRIILPGTPFADEKESQLKHGRQVWSSYLAQLQLVDNGLGRLRCTLSLNLVATVGLPEMPAVELLAHFVADPKHNVAPSAQDVENMKWYLENGGKYYPEEELGNAMPVINGATGFVNLKVSYTQIVERGKKSYKRIATVKGVTKESADKRTFDHPELGEITVADYFEREHGITLKNPKLPCLQLGNFRNCVPLELVHVLGGEHNIMAGKLRPEYQQSVTRQTTMDPPKRQRRINDMVRGELGPSKALQQAGFEVSKDMMTLTGRVLRPPKLEQHNGQVMPNGYANGVKAVSPPDYLVQWGIWCYSKDGRDADFEDFQEQWVKTALRHGIRFADKPTYSEWKHLLEDKHGLDRALRQLWEIHLLVVLLPKDGADDFYNQLKMLTELEIGCKFATQCVKCQPKKQKNGLQASMDKLNNLTLKVIAKLPREDPRTRKSWAGAHNVRLVEPHHILKGKKTMVLGADVTHNARTVSVAGVVASQDCHFANYFADLRAQSPFTLNAEKQRSRQSEERIVDLSSMVAGLLQNWKANNGGDLPEVVLYYRDGVSYGQFKNVLTLELNHLAQAFSEVGGEKYEPQLVIIVGQKRHQTRFFPEGGAAEDKGKGSTKGKGKDKGKEKGKEHDKGKGKGKGKPKEMNVPAGTVVGEGIATPGHLNFYLVAHDGNIGTSVPCHYHVLHLDSRLKLDADDIEQITYDLCHLYSRADKTVSYASPAYLADHLCERGKKYLETLYSDDLASSSPSGGGEEEEKRFREQVEWRVNDFNKWAVWIQSSHLQGLHFFC